MGVSQMLSDLKAHLEHGAELVASHVPVLVEWAQKAESDPLVQAAIDLAVPASTRAMLATLLKTVEAEVRQVEAEAAAAAQQPPAEPAAETPPA
jgi:DNA polymerase IIIc chi subunit